MKKESEQICYGSCKKSAVWVRCTQFAGDHYFCDEHAKKESDFAEKDDSYFFWRKVKGDK